MTDQDSRDARVTPVEDHEPALPFEAAVSVANPRRIRLSGPPREASAHRS